MEWVRAHRYACTISAVCVIVIAGALIVRTHSSLAMPSGISAWSGGNGALVNGTAAQTTAGTSSQTTPPVDNSTVDTGTLPYGSPSKNPLAQETDTSSGQLNALLSELSGAGAAQPASSGSQSASPANVTSAYAFIPSGTLAVSDTSEQNYTSDQENLYIYGNAAGTFIQAYDQNDADQAQVLTDSAQSRQDATKSQAVEKIGNDLIAVGKHLGAISDVPPQAQADNTALAQSYEDDGAALEKVAAETNGSDSDFVASMQAYDATANTLVQHYAALALLFSASGVSFSSSDPGSVFSFSESGGL